ncbi:HU family DNA-binding protein [Candidatus Comchoanobacter bicostacola]|uniref:HU family DNA-binding protein n=1 Tax=Candidatus Comchoanobacter bicostacola TaxID=2919598 RepID=A0ABY5DML6_9GAMM|nr:HU family DNA-binding protein [Candidatus Comchoanobacter bicostacola]
MVANKTGMNQKQIGEVLEAILEVMKTTVSSKGKLTIPGFFTLVVKNRKARTGRNPQTGAEIQIAEKDVPSFKAGSELKEAADS